MHAGIKVFAPATVSNVACGFDILGFALDEPGDEVIARFSDKPGIHISHITGDKGKLPYEVQLNTAGFAAMKLLQHLGEKEIGIELEIHKKMPFGSGLGSSGASAVAGAMAVNELLKRPLEKRDLLPFVMEAEQMADGGYHADNVAPSLLGGMVFIRSNEGLDVHRLTIPPGIFVVVAHPHIEVLTRDSRNLLSPTLSMKQHIQQSGNLGGLIIGLFRSDFELIRRSLQDVIVESQRAILIPGYSDVKKAAMEAGALGCNISGAGPSVFALCENSLIAEEVGTAMRMAFSKAGVDCTIYESSINQEGAVKC